MTRSARPYLVADQETVCFRGWWFRRGDAREVLPEALPDWDCRTDLHLTADLLVDREKLARSTGLDRGTALNVVVSWRSVDGRVGATVYRHNLAAAETHVLDAVLPGPELGSEIDLWVRLVLAQDVPHASVGVARLAGSVLWEHPTRLTLVGDATRFPVSVIDFEAAGLDVDAGWVLQLPERLDAPVLGEVLLLVNSGDAALVVAVTGPSPDQHAVRALFEQIAIQLLEFAAARADELTAEEWEPGSFGASLLALAGREPGGLTSLAALRDLNPTRYRARLAGAARRNAGVGEAGP